MADTTNVAMDGYRGLLQRIDAWSARAAADHPGVIPCRQGCSACCHGPFDISMADAALLAPAIAALPHEARAAVGARADNLLGRMREIAPAWTAPYRVDAIGDDAFDALCDALAHAPCPLLDEAGACRVYADRPLVCRLIGVPLAAGEDRVIPNACPIQEDFPAYADLAPQPFDLDAFDTAEQPWLAEGARQYVGSAEEAGTETTIAAVVVTVLANPR